MVLTGLPNIEASEEMMHTISPAFKHPAGYYRLPIPPATKTGPFRQFPGWSIPEPVKEKTIALCESLSKYSGEMVLHWERDEFRHCIQDAGLIWPENISHQRLKLLRNRYPVISGFDNKARADLY